MNKENKVTSLKLSKKIQDKAKEKGFELPESEYCWRDSKRFGVELVSIEEFRILDGSRIKLVSEKGLYKGYFAYDIAELGKILKKAFDNLSGTMINDPRGHYKRLWQRTTGFEDEAEARGNLCFYLLDNDLL